MRSIGNDIRYALRQLKKSPGFATVAILTLAVGIGATTAIFTLVYDVLLKPLPYAQPGQLVVLQEQVAEFKDLYPTLPLNANHFVRWQRDSKSFDSMTAIQQDSVPLGAGDHPLLVPLLRATSGIFPVLGATPQLGRGFTAHEDQPGHEHVVVLMHGLWKQEFHSDPKILGQTVKLDGFAYTVIGVMPQSFHLPTGRTFVAGGSTNTSSADAAEAIVPMAFADDQLKEAMGSFNYFGLARLKPGVSAEQAQSEIDSLQHGISAALPANERATLSAVIVPFQQFLAGDNRKSMGILLAAVASLLLIGCINIANLLLARAVGRRQEMAVAAALGATRADLLRASMRESCVLATIGAVLGVLFATVTVPILQQYLPPALNFRGNLHIDWTGAGFAALLAFASALLAGAAPAWTSWRTQPQDALRGARTTGETRAGKRLRKSLVALEVTISVGLVLTTGLLTASLYRLMHVARGFQASRVLTARIDLPDKAYPTPQAGAAFYRQLLEKLDHFPGVEHVAVTNDVPFDGETWGDIAELPGDARSFTQMPTQNWRWISPGYFQALGLPLVQGRFLSLDDRPRQVAVVSQLTAQSLWPGKNPIGQQFKHGTDKNYFTVVGVVGNARTITLSKPDPMIIYVPYWYQSDNRAGLVLRTKEDPASMANAVRKAVWSMNPEVAVPNIRTLGGVIANSVDERRFEMDLLLLFAICAWLLAGLGVYGVVTYSVAQRRQEIGLRMALGAQRGNVYRQVLREGLAPVLAGAVIGIAIAFGFGRLIASLLFHVSPFNPAIAAAAAVSLLLIGVFACLLPARHAASVDPMQSLRTE